MSAALLLVEKLIKRFRLNDGRSFNAVDKVDLTIQQREILCLVGESGSGKSTLGKTLAGIHRSEAGRVSFLGRDVTNLTGQARSALAAEIQYLYQDAGAAFDPRWTIARSLHEPLIIHKSVDGAERDARVRGLLGAVGLRDEHLQLYPHELSGGQQRRAGIARALTLRPKLLVLDEPTSGLDVSVQATILKLLRTIQAEFDLTFLFISHDLAVVRSISTRVAIMYLGRIVEIGSTAEIFERPQHPYTRSLLDAVPIPGGRRVIDAAWLEGDPPDPFSLGMGCRFRSRCPIAGEICARIEPSLEPVSSAHAASCHFAGERRTDP